MQFNTKHKQYEHLRKKWINKHKSISERFWTNHGNIARQLTLGGLGGMMMLTVPGTTLLSQYATQAQAEEGVTKSADRHADLVAVLKDKIPANNEVRPLNPEEEDEISTILSKQLKLSIKPEIDGIRLNRSYGLIGGEQHLYRFPGDTVYQHADNANEWAMYGGSGIAPGLGAWGYFTPSKEQFTEKDKMRERYYLAVQTFLAPGFAENVAKYRDFFKYRKMIVVNPKTGQTVVAVIGDAGPAEFTGKSLGGSPEVMEAVGLAQGPRKGAVLYFFIDDPNDQIPLGPVSLAEEVR